MRKDILDLLRCPGCRSCNLGLRIQDRNAVGERNSELVCGTCGALYPIVDGIVDLLKDPGEAVTREIAGWDSLVNAVDQSDELMLSLPYATQDGETWLSQAQNFEQLMTFAALDGSETLLDLGAGRCWTTRTLAKAVKRAVAVDVVLTKYVGLKTGEIFIAHDGIYFDRVRGDMHDLPFIDNAFDTVFLAATLHHSPDLRRLMQEVSRVLKERGRLLVTNEPVVGIFQDSSPQGPEVEAGINEHLYRLFHYAFAFRKAGISTTLRLFIGGGRFYNRLLIFAHSLFSPGTRLRSTAERLILYAQLFLFGGVLVSTGLKRRT